jgi:hypothetical protein
MRDRTRAAPLATPEFGKYRNLFRRLAEDFDIGVYNLNYDNLALKARPKAFVGFDRRSGIFSPRAVQRRRRWHFVYHLHGSVHHSLPTHRVGISEWYDDLSRPDFNDGHSGLSDFKGTDDRKLPRTTLVAGGWKIDQLQMEPYHTFYSTLARHLSEADAILVGGYGFGDDHIGNALRNRLEHGGQIPVVVLDYADPKGKTDPMEFRMDTWSTNLRNSLDCRCGFREAGSPNSVPPVISDLVARNAFEVSTDPQRPVAIWYGGFYTAACRAGDISNWLLGNPAAL